MIASVAIPIVAILFEIFGFSHEIATAVGLVALLTLMGSLIETVARWIESQPFALKVLRDDSTATRTVTNGHLAMQSANVDLLELSGSNSVDLLQALVESGAARRTRLLVANPTQLNDYQRSRAASALDRLSVLIPIEDVTKIGLKVWCYNETPSVRGRSFGDSEVLVGWYSYDDRGFANDNQQISGGTNPSVLASKTTGDGAQLIAFFRRVFDGLLKRAAPVNTAWSPYHGQAGINLPNRAWLNAVSGTVPTPITPSN